MTSSGLPSRLLFVADAGQAPEGLSVLVSRAASAGIRFIELRRKDALGTARRLQELRDCLEAAPEATLIVNDRVDLALAAGAAGAHVGQDDLHPVEARRLLGPDRLLGLSTHDEAQAQAGSDLPVDYLAFGPVFLSRTKSGHAEPQGLDALRRTCSGSTKPIVAIGGIDAGNAAAVLEAGAACIAIAAGLAYGELEANLAALLGVIEAS